MCRQVVQLCPFEKKRIIELWHLVPVYAKSKLSVGKISHNIIGIGKREVSVCALQLNDMSNERLYDPSLRSLEIVNLF